MAAGSEAVAIMLDISNTYDSMSGPFYSKLYAGVVFLTIFFTMMDSLHVGESSRIVIKGYMSRPISVQIDFRQGYP